MPRLLSFPPGLRLQPPVHSSGPWQGLLGSHLSYPVTCSLDDSGLTSSVQRQISGPCPLPPLLVAPTVLAT